MRNRNRWTTFWIFIQILQLISSKENNNGEPSFQHIFSPRMDYEQWKPIGTGDPLKHDPTFDYVPPVLDQVQYWVDPASRKPDPPIPGETQKTEILLLGVTSRKPTNTPLQADSKIDNFDPFIKYVDGPKFNHNSNRRVGNPMFFPNPSPFFPSFFPPKEFIHSNKASFSKGPDQRIPSTILMPPPFIANINTPQIQQELPVTQSTIFTTPSSSTFEASSPSVTLQPANLVYHSSSSFNSDSNNFNKGSTLPSSISFKPSVTTDKTIPDFRDEIIYNTHLTPPESFIKIQFAPHNFTNKPLLGLDTNQHISFVTPPPLIKMNENSIMFKGKVTDDDISNTYVKIGKPEAEVEPTFIEPNLNTIIQHPIPVVPNMVMFPHSGKPKKNFESKLPPLTMQILKEMQEMRPPPVTESSMFQKGTSTIFKLLDSEKSSSVGNKETTIVSNPSELLLSSPSLSTVFMTSPSTTISTTTTNSTTETEIESTSQTETETYTTPSSTTTSTTPIIATTPTNELLKHFKPPMKATKSPLYLIIQGHSKVKTYGPSKQMHGILIQDSNEITENDDNYSSNMNSYANSLQGYDRSKLDEMSLRQGRSRNLGNIQTLKHVVQTGLGAIDLTGLIADIDRNDKNFRETELYGGYEVVDHEDAMTEKYYKGIVEEARKLKV